MTAADGGGPGLEDGRRARRPGLAALALLAILAPGAALPSLAQTPTAQPSTAQAGSGVPTRIDPGANSGLPGYNVGCTGEQASRPTLRCEIAFDAPAQVEGTRVVERGSGRAWTSAFTAIDPATDDSAFLFLVDRADPRRAASLARIARDLREIVARTGPRQQVAIATFGRSYTPLQSFTSDRQALQNAAGRIAPEGTSRELYRFMRDGIQALQAVQARQKVLVVVSDGQSDDTEFTRAEVEAMLRAAAVRFVGVGVVESEGEAGNLQSLRRIAETPGHAFLGPFSAARGMPAETRSAFLTRFTAGGTLTAEAPGTGLPAGVDITLRFAQDRASTFSLETPARAFGGTAQAATAGSGPGAASAPASEGFPGLGSLRLDGDLVQNAREWLSANSTAAIAGGVGLLVLLGGLVFALARSRDPAPALAGAGRVGPHGPLGGLQPAPGPAHHPPHPPGPAPGGPPGPTAPQAPAVQVTPIPPLREPPTRVEEPGERHVLAYLEMADAQRRRIAIHRNFTTIGRLEGENDIVLLDKNVSRVHAQLRVNDAGKWEVVNLTWDRPEGEGGRNPIAVNGEPVMERRVLHDGDVVRLGNVGNTQFTFRSASTPAGRR